MKGLMSKNQCWHFDNLVKKYQENKGKQGYPFYISLQDYFAEEDGPEIDDEEHAKVIMLFSRYCLEDNEERLVIDYSLEDGIVECHGFELSDDLSDEHIRDLCEDVIANRKDD